MAKLVRFGVSMDAELLAAFDDLIAGRGYANRSEAIRDMAREAIVRGDWDDGRRPAVAALCLVYDQQAGDLARRLGPLQRQHAHAITATLRVPLGPSNCLDILVLRGVPADLRALADQFLSTRGVKHGQLVMTTTGAKLP